MKSKSATVEIWLEKQCFTKSVLLLHAIKTIRENSFFVTRGTTVRCKETSGQFTKIGYKEYDFRAIEVTVTEKYTGWLLSSILASRVERHLFHLIAVSPTPDQWNIKGDRGHDFQLYWTPLSARPQLVRGQDRWLERIYDQLY